MTNKIVEFLEKNEYLVRVKNDGEYGCTAYFPSKVGLEGKLDGFVRQYLYEYNKDSSTIQICQDKCVVNHVVPDYSVRLCILCDIASLTEAVMGYDSSLIKFVNKDNEVCDNLYAILPSSEEMEEKENILVHIFKKAVANEFPDLYFDIAKEKGVDEGFRKAYSFFGEKA